LSGTQSAVIDPVRVQSYKISADGTGNIKGAVACDDTLTVIISGAGSVTVTGSARKLVVEIHGTGSFYGDAFYADEASVTISGTGNAAGWVLNSLTAAVSGSGSITYYGNPARVAESRTGTGRIQKR
jgi:hypothetical protein